MNLHLINNYPVTVSTIVENGKTIVKERGVTSCHKIKAGYVVLTARN